MLDIEEVFAAYYECRRHKRYTNGSLAFEVNLEENLVALYEELCSGQWAPGPSSVFIVTHPVRREIFAASFRDRVVHHLLIRRLNPSLEKHFIHDSYACRTGKGTHAAIKRLEHFMRSATKNGSQTAHVLKIDIQSFFMSIDRSLLYTMLDQFLDTLYKVAEGGRSIEFEKDLCRKIIFNDPTVNCVFKSPESAWQALPRGKSLFDSPSHCGLPIGNLTSQVFANFYLSAFDHFVKHELGIKKYLRYVDDCVIVHEDKKYLKRLVSRLNSFLATRLALRLHPRKIYLQPCQNGVAFLGVFIKPSHTVAGRRVRHNFLTAVLQHAQLALEQRPCPEERQSCFAVVNSYLGIVSHYKTYRFRKRIMQRLLRPWWQRWFVATANVRKLTRRHQYDCFL